MKNISIRAMALLLAILMMIPMFVACTETYNPDFETTTISDELVEDTTLDEPTPTTPEETTTSEEPTSTTPEETTTSEEPTSTTPEETPPVVEPPATNVKINAESISSLKLIRSSTLNSRSAEVTIFSAFMSQIRDLFSVTPEPATDNSAQGKLEIVIGATTREASAAFNQKLTALGTPAYGISVSEGKICVDGTSAYLIFKALDYLLVNLVTKDENGKDQILLDIGYEYIEQTDKNYPSLEEVMASGHELCFYATEKIMTIPSQGSFNVLQGAGSDGKYAYFALIDKSGSVEKAIIRKYDMETWELVATSGEIPSYHTNDITYDSKNNRLVICTCDAHDEWRGVVYVNPDTLEVIEHTLIPTGGRALTYLPATDQYISALEYGYVITNDKFERVTSFQDQYSKLTTQGFDCDGTYIYDPRYEKSAAYQTVVVHKVDGTFVGAVPLYGVDGEPEDIICDDDGTFIMQCNGAKSVFRLVLMYKNWW